jgi:hypothetical protein
VVQFGLWIIEKKNTTTIYRQFGNRVKVLKNWLKRKTLPLLPLTALNLPTGR